MFVIRRTTNIRAAKKRSATTSFFRLALSEKVAKQLLCQLPVVEVDAVFHLGSLHLALYQSGILQFL